MSVAVENIKIMVVDTSTAMLDVLKNFSDKHGYESANFSDPALACTALSKRFEQFDSDYRCVILGWPEGSVDIIDDLLGELALADHQDLPVLILCQEMTAEIKMLVKRRARTRALLWKDFQAAADVIDRLVLAPTEGPEDKISQQNSQGQASKSTVGILAKLAAKNAEKPTITSPAVINTLILDSAPAANRALRDMMESHGYQVTLASSVTEGRKAIEKRQYDLVVADFFLRGEGGEEFCRYLQAAENLPGRKPVCVIISSKYSDAIVKRSLSVGALSCFYKDESTELLFARIDALARALPAYQSSPVVDDAVVEMLELAIDPAVLIDRHGVIAGVNKKARRLLDDINRHELTGRHFSRVVHSTPIILEKPQNVGFLTSSGSEIAVSYMAQHISIKGNDSGVLVTFNPQPVRLKNAKLNSAPIVIEAAGKSDVAAGSMSAAGASVATVKQTETKQTAAVQRQAERVVTDAAVQAAEMADMAPVAVDKPKVQSTKEQFTNTLQLAIAGGASGPRYCVLVLDIQLIAATGDRLSLGHSEPMLEIVKESLANLYTREHSFSYLGEGQFGFVLASRRKQDALVLTQNLVRVIPQLVKYLSNMTLVSHGALLQLSQDTPTDVDKALSKCRRGCAKALKDNRDNSVLVMPMNKYLSADSLKQKKATREKVASE